MRQEKTCVSDPFAVVCAPRLSSLTLSLFLLKREEGNPTGGFGLTPPEQQERLSHMGLIDYPYCNEPLGRFLLCRLGTN